MTCVVQFDTNHRYHPIDNIFVKLKTCKHYARRLCWSHTGAIDVWATVAIMYIHTCIQTYRVCQKSSPPPTTFNNIFAWVFCIKFCTFIGNLYPHMCTNFGLFILTFNEMALI